MRQNGQQSSKEHPKRKTTKENWGSSVVFRENGGGTSPGQMWKRGGIRGGEKKRDCIKGTSRGKTVELCWPPRMVWTAQVAPRDGGGEGRGGGGTAGIKK